LGRDSTNRKREKKKKKEKTEQEWVCWEGNLVGLGTAIGIGEKVKRISLTSKGGGKRTLNGLYRELGGGRDPSD